MTAGDGGSSDGEAIKFVAPFDLPEGYVFDATVDGKTFQVTVPRGGIAEGDIIDVTKYIDGGTEMLEDSTRSDNNNSGFVSPLDGAWRFGLFSCCEVICSSMFWMSLILPWILLAQLMQRIKLNFWGMSCGNYHNTCVLITTFVALSIIAQGILFYFFMQDTTNGIFSSIFAAIGAYEILLVFYWSVRLRMESRRKFNIPNSKCCDCNNVPLINRWCCFVSSSGIDGKKKGSTTTLNCCEDCCITLFCSACSLMQIGRHTEVCAADDGNTKPKLYFCWTKTGLKPNAPDVV